MGSWVSLQFLLITYDILIDREEEVVGYGYFNAIPKVVMDKKVMGMNYIIPSIQHNVRNSHPLDESPEFLN